MFFLFGIRTKSKPVNQIQYPCSNCKRATVFTAMESKRWFTLVLHSRDSAGGQLPDSLQSLRINLEMLAGIEGADRCEGYGSRRLDG